MKSSVAFKGKLKEGVVVEEVMMHRIGEGVVVVAVLRMRW